MLPHAVHRRQKRHTLREVERRLRDAMYSPVGELTVEAWVTQEPVPFEERQSGKHLELKPGDKWGGLFDCAWFRFTGAVPPETAGREVVLLLDVNGEMLVVDPQGNPWQGLTSVTSGYDYSLGAPGKRVLDLVGPIASGDVIEVWADAGCNDLFRGCFGRTAGSGGRGCRAQHGDQTLTTTSRCSQLMEQLPEGSPDGIRSGRRWVVYLWRRSRRRDSSRGSAGARAAAGVGWRYSLTISAIGRAHGSGLAVADSWGDPKGRPHAHYGAADDGRC